MSETRFAPAEENPSPRFRGEREGPAPPAWEGEVGPRASRPHAAGTAAVRGECSGIPHLTPTLSAPRGGEGVNAGIGDWNDRLPDLRGGRRCAAIGADLSAGASRLQDLRHARCAEGERHRLPDLLRRPALRSRM